MDSLRYFAAMLTVVIAPPFFLSWLLIHPFAAIWRKLGSATYFFMLIFLTASIIGLSSLYGIHEDLLYFGLNYVTAALSFPCFFLAAAMAIYYRKYLTPAILIGLPEISQEDYPGTLLTEGIYSKIRHPRYVGAYFFILGWAFLANSPVPYMVAAALLPVIYIIVLFEERELHKRFGSEYKQYCQEVPRYLPKIIQKPSQK